MATIGIISLCAATSIALKGNDYSKVAPDQGNVVTASSVHHCTGNEPPTRPYALLFVSEVLSFPSDKNWNGLGKRLMKPFAPVIWE